VKLAGKLLTLLAPGEIAVGIALLAFPAFGSVLIGAPIEGIAVTAVRMLGAAALAVGLTWWAARNEPPRFARYTASWLAYNLGVGAMFVWAALGASAPLVPALLGLVHIGAGVAFAVAMAADRSASTDR
jgi:hypothetical protein